MNRYFRIGHRRYLLRRASGNTHTSAARATEWSIYELYPTALRGEQQKLIIHTASLSEAQHHLDQLAMIPERNTPYD